MALLGILIDFLSKFANRSKKGNFDIKYWWKDNWIEFTQSLIVVAALMFIITHPDFVVNPEAFQKWLSGFLPIPDGVIFPMTLFIPLIIGLMTNKIVYWYNKKKENWAIKKQIDNK